MPDLWPNILHVAEIAGVEIPVSRRRIQGGNAFARRRYPHRNGQKTEDTGREPYVFSLDVPLFADVDPAHYPGTYDTLRLSLENERDPVEYVDPFLGPITVKVSKWSDDMDARKRDGVMVSIELEEETQDGPLFTIDADQGAGATAAALDTDEALEGLGLTDEDVSAILAAAGVPLDDASVAEGDGAMSGLTSSTLAGLRNGLQQADEIRSRVDRTRAQVDAVRTHVSSLTGDTWQALESLERIAAGVAGVGAGLIESAHTAEMTLSAPMSAWQIAVLMLGDGTRASEIIEANPTANPLRYPVGQAIRVALG